MPPAHVMGAQRAPLEPPCVTARGHRHWAPPGDRAQRGQSWEHSPTTGSTGAAGASRVVPEPPLYPSSSSTRCKQSPRDLQEALRRAQGSARHPAARRRLGALSHLLLLLTRRFGAELAARGG